MKTETCGNCGKTARIVRRNYRFDEMGLPLELLRIEVIECSHCGNTDPIIPNMDGLIHAVALAVVFRPCKLDGEEVRFLRKYVGKSAHDFARFLHVDNTHLSKVENNRVEIGIRLDKLVRLLVINLSPELEDTMKRFLELLPDLQDSCPEVQPEIHIDPATLHHEYA
jgi:transcriptional regulator with XRE-family HTH domain